jgi:hypothetical protein
MAPLNLMNCQMKGMFMKADLFTKTVLGVIALLLGVLTLGPLGKVVGAGAPTLPDPLEFQNVDLLPYGHSGFIMFVNEPANVGRMNTTLSKGFAVLGPVGRSCGSVETSSSSR